MQCNNDDPGEHEQFDEELVGLCNPVVPKADSIVGLSRNNQARYRLTNLLGRGGMGIVYRAEDLELQRTVAIKLVLPKRISRVGKRSVAEEILQLQKEARDAGKLQHTNIVHIYRFLILDKNWREKILFDEGISLEEDPVACLVMQFIDGDRLVSFTDSPHREFIPSTEEFADTIAETVFDHGGLLEPSSAPARHSLSANHKESEDREGRDRQRIKKSYIRKMATIGECIADALEHAHHEGVRHNDVKPQNILVDRDGNAWLTDFGLAHSKLDPIVDSSSIVGTYAYLAPEAANGINDHRRDIFALGATLYRMLTFETVFTAQSAKEFRESKPVPGRQKCLSKASRVHYARKEVGGRQSGCSADDILGCRRLTVREFSPESVSRELFQSNVECQHREVGSRSHDGEPTKRS